MFIFEGIFYRVWGSDGLTIVDRWRDLLRDFENYTSVTRGAGGANMCEKLTIHRWNCLARAYVGHMWSGFRNIRFDGAPKTAPLFANKKNKTYRFPSKKFPFQSQVMSL